MKPYVVLALLFIPLFMVQVVSDYNTYLCHKWQGKMFGNECIIPERQEYCLTEDAGLRYKMANEFYLPPNLTVNISS